MKYHPILAILENEGLYSPSTVAKTGEASGLLNTLLGEPGKQVTKEDIARAKLRIRHTLARLATNHGFPQLGDGLVFVPGQTPLCGWYGWRWKQAAGLQVEVQGSDGNDDP